MNTKLYLLPFVLAGLLTADSLWKDDISRAPVADKKARFIGDILNVRVQESNAAKRNGKTSSSKSSSAASGAAAAGTPVPAGRGRRRRRGRGREHDHGDNSKHINTVDLIN